MKSISLMMLLLTLACSKQTKEGPLAQDPGPVTCGKGPNSLIDSPSCLPAAVWNLRMPREGFSDRLSLRINQRELFNTCETEEHIISTEFKNDSVTIRFGYLALPTNENISLEIFHCDDGRRFAHADPAVFEIVRNQASNVYSVTTELQKD